MTDRPISAVIGRSTLTRLPAGIDGSRYLHPNGYIIERQRRTWSERTGRINGQADHPPPMHWWSVYNHIARRRSMLAGRPAAFLGLASVRPQPGGRDFDTLRDARAWCDANPREGWQC